MEQKRIWTLLLLIGVLSSVLTSCTEADVDKAYYNDMYYVNETNHELYIEMYQYINESVDTLKYVYFINKGDAFYQEIELNMGARNGEIIYADSCVIKFDNERIASFDYHTNRESAFHLMNHENYTFEEISDNRDKYTYTFTEADFENATEIVK